MKNDRTGDAGLRAGLTIVGAHKDVQIRLRSIAVRVRF